MTMEDTRDSSSYGLKFLRSVSLKLDLEAVRKKRIENVNDLSTPKSPSLKNNQLNLTFNDLSYSVRSGLLSKERKNVLSNINGDFRPGELTAIMGPSGAGKSTLMDILAGFTSSSVTGDVRVNGRPRNLAAFRRSSAYIMQNDNLQALLTVQEVMRIAADLKLEPETPSCMKQQGIDIILREMNLETARTTCTGKLSGGQKKRLAIALELISNPPIMFFDEPTSGLDSVMSRQCIGLLKSLAREGRTVVCTIHQPSASLFDIIDHLYVVADGQCVYAGSPRNIVHYLRSFGLQCPTYHNPADFLLEVISGDYGDYSKRLCGSWKNETNNLWRSSKDQVKFDFEKVQKFDVAPKLPLSATPISYECDSRGSAYYATSSWRQFRVLLWRNAIRLSRDKVLTFTRLTMHLLIALLVGILFYKIGQDAAYALDNLNLLFFSIMFVGYSAFSSTLITFPAELPILTREHFNRWYKLHSFYLASKIADFPVQIAAAVLYTFIVYQMSGQIPEIQRFSMFVVICIIISLVAQIIGLIMGIMCDVKIGVIFGPFVILPFILFSGFFIHLNDAHPYFQWMFHVSFFKYGFEGVVQAIYGYDRSKMICNDIYCHFRSPKVIINTMGMKHSNYWHSITFLIGLYIVLDVIAYMALRLKLLSRKFR